MELPTAEVALKESGTDMLQLTTKRIKRACGVGRTECSTFSLMKEDIEALEAKGYTVSQEGYSNSYKVSWGKDI